MSQCVPSTTHGQHTKDDYQWHCGTNNQPEMPSYRLIAYQVWRRNTDACDIHGCHGSLLQSHLPQ